MAYIQSYPNQTYLIPPNITDLFSKNHVCYLIEQIANEMDYSEFDSKYAGAGHPAYHPRIMLKLLTMAYIDGMRSSRRMAKNSQENVVYIYLSEKTQPDFRTISDFRKDNEKLIKSTFKQIVRFAHDNGWIDLSHLMIDGTTIKANANDDKNLSKDEITKLERHIDNFLQECEKVDEEENIKYGDKNLHELPEGLIDRQKRQPVVRKIVDEINKAMQEGEKDKLEEIKSELQSIKQSLEGKNQNKHSFTDPDSRFMMNKKHNQELSYNTQLVTDKNGLIISNDVIQRGDDCGQLLPNIRRVEKDFGKLPKGTKISADNHYGRSGEDIETLEGEGFDIYSPVYGMHKAKKKKFDKLNFDYDKEKDCFICPVGEELNFTGNYFNKKLNQHRRIFKTKACLTCPHQKECCDNKKRQKIIHALPGFEAIERMKKKMQTEEGKKIYDLRKQTVEPGFGDIKHNKKFREFLVRGVKKAKTEWNLVCMASNLVKINNMLNRRSITSC